MPAPVSSSPGSLLPTCTVMSSISFPLPVETTMSWRTPCLLPQSQRRDSQVPCAQGGYIKCLMLDPGHGRHNGAQAISLIRARSQLHSTHRDPMDYSPPGSSVHGIFQARIWEWVAISYSRFLTVYGYNCSISLFIIVVSILLCLICKLNVIIGTHMLENILGFSTI